MRPADPLTCARSYMQHYFRGRNENQTDSINEVSRAITGDAPRVIRLTLWVILALVALSFIWVGFARIDEVTRGEGKAILSLKLRKIQDLEEGIVTELCMYEGQIVNAGILLLHLNDTRFVSNVGETEADKLGLRARVEHLTAEVENRDFAILPEIASQAPEVARGETELYNDCRGQFHNEVSGLEEQLVQKKQELHNFELKEGQFKYSLGSVRQEIKTSEPLFASGAISKVELLRLHRTEVETAGQFNSISLPLPRTTSEIKEIENKVGESHDRFQSGVLAQLDETRTSLSETQTSVKALEDRVNHIIVTSPVRDIVQQVIVNIIGGVTQPGDDLVEVAPLDDKLLTEAKIQPCGIAFLHPGQHAVVKSAAYDYIIYGGLQGEVVQAGPGTVIDKQRRSSYIVCLQTDKDYLGAKEHPMLIIPGMVASVDILTDEKTILSYLLKPIICARVEVLREH